ncbi:iron chelate uptake ABC transporter family permease subunit [Longispora sp. NPDC051575]|uniref:FecCD family ABC transporter permease n=1 Tax=Longispora sp. NPDC051575 TaxID=3154943 RepID=UPI00343CA272
MTTTPDAPAATTTGAAGTTTLARRRVPHAGLAPVRVGRVSGLVRLRAVLVGLLGLAGLCAAAVAGIGHGDYPMHPADVVDVLFGGGTKMDRYVVFDLRLPRVLTGALVGLALGLAGALTQTVARNALASPDVLGVTQGASVGAVAVVVLGGAGAAVSVPVAALLGALAAAVAVYALAWRRGVHGHRFILIGLAVGEVLSGLVSYLLVRAEIVDAAKATIWLNGSLSNRDWSSVRPLALSLCVLVPLALATSFPTRALQFGDDTARGLGVRLQRAQLVVLLAAVGLAAAATAAAGPIGFVAFLTPQVALRLVGGPKPPPLVSAVLGACLLVTADLVARTLTPHELPAGLVTAAVGAPYLLWLLTRTRRTS